MSVQDASHAFFTYGLIYSILFCVSRTIIDVVRWLSRKGKSADQLAGAGEDSAEAFGERAEHRAEQELRGLDIPTLRNVFLHGPMGRLTEIDLLALVGNKILVIEVKSWPGQIAGDQDAKEWIQIKETGDRKVMMNPLAQNRHHLRVLQAALPEAACKGLVVFIAGAFADTAPSGVVDLPALLAWVYQHRSEEPDDSTLLGWGKLSNWAAQQNKSELRETLMAQIRDRREQVPAEI